MKKLPLGSIFLLSIILSTQAFCEQNLMFRAAPLGFGFEYAYLDAQRSGLVLRTQVDGFIGGRRESTHVAYRLSPFEGLFFQAGVGYAKLFYSDSEDHDKGPSAFTSVGYEWTYTDKPLVLGFELGMGWMKDDRQGHKDQRYAEWPRFRIGYRF